MQILLITILCLSICIEQVTTQFGLSPVNAPNHESDVQAKAAPAVFKDELMSHFQPQLNEQRISEVSDLLSRIRQAAKVKFYGGGMESRDDLTEIGLCGYGIKAGGGIGDHDNVPLSPTSCANKTSGHHRRPLIVDEVTSIGVGHPNFSVPLAKYLFEGDILLTPVQANSILVQLTQENELAARRSERSSLKRKRAILTNDQKLRWKNLPIQYDIDYSYNSDDRQAIQDAISYWSQHTCLSISYSPGVSTGDYINVFPGNGCYSMVGRQGGKQSVSIGDGCIVSGVIAHEFGHALGLWHEQSRPDADTYIRVLTNDILAGLLSNFLQRTWDTVDSFGVPYDYGSVMHYDSTSFSYNGESKTIETLQPNYQRTIGQREHPSFYDVKIMNEAYCKDKCAADLDCNYGGYTHPGYCNQCLCPDGTGGYYCERSAEPKNADCGGIITVNSLNATVITSPDYPSPGYRKGQECSWILKSDPGTRMTLQFVETFQIFCFSTCLDYVEVKNTADFGNTGARFCCYDLPTDVIYSETNTMIVIFRATWADGGYAGFKANVGVYANDAKAATKKQKLPSTRRPTVSSKKPVINKTPKPVKGTPKKPLWRTTQGVGSWAAWQPWSPCSRSCGGCGVQQRVRKCKTSNCRGVRRQYQRCSFANCPSDVLCSETQVVDKQCTDNSEKICANFQDVTFKCTYPSCCEPYKLANGSCLLLRQKPDDKVHHDENDESDIGEKARWSAENDDDANDIDSDVFKLPKWGQWGEWSGCVGATCGGCALKARIRACLSESCDGPETEYERCNTEPCLDCDSPPAKEGSVSPWTIGQCSNDPSSLCVLPKKDTDKTCPCCPPLVLKNGLCRNRDE